MATAGEGGNEDQLHLLDVGGAGGLVSEELLFESCQTGSALFSRDLRYRYKLTRRWERGGFAAAFVMLNPSTAGAAKNDPTITRCMGFAKRLGASSMVVVNLGARISPEPKDLLSCDDPVGAINLAVLEESLESEGVETIVAWGALSTKLEGLLEKSLKLCFGMSCLKCLGKTKGGHPRHPLYLPADAELTPWSSVDIV